MKPSVYLDHAASSPTDPRVVEQMLGWMGSANPGSVHRSGQKAAAALAKSRRRTAICLGVAPEQIVFTSGGTESNNLALYGALSTGDHVVACPTEHPSVVNPLRALVSSKQIEVDWLSVDSQGQVKLSDIQKKIKQNTRMIVVQGVNSETGAVQPVEQIGRIADEAGIFFFCDAAQWFAGNSKSPVFLGVTHLSLSGHKFGGPKGVGCLFLRDPNQARPQQFGGDQEQAVRPGTPNIPGVVGLATALELWQAESKERIQKFSSLNQLLAEQLGPLGQAVLKGSSPASPQIVSFLFPGYNAQQMLMQLDLLGLEVSSGSACSLGKGEPSAVLLAMGVPPDIATTVLRFSFGPNTESQDIRRLAEGLRNLMESS